MNRLYGLIRTALFPKSYIGIVCCVVITISSSHAFDIEWQSGSTLSAVDITGEQFKSKVKEYLGIPYRRGGASKKGMDCSSFVRIVYNRLYNIELPFSARGQFRSSRLKKIDDHNMQSGDLIFFSHNKKKGIDHVGMYFSDGQFIHASSSRGIAFSSLENPYWKKRFVASKHRKILTMKRDSD
jgi:cell wall-associated NlpC family hydrolase